MRLALFLISGVLLSTWSFSAPSHLAPRSTKNTIHLWDRVASDVEHWKSVDSPEAPKVVRITGEGKFLSLDGEALDLDPENKEAQPLLQLSLKLKEAYRRIQLILATRKMTAEQMLALYELLRQDDRRDFDDRQYSTAEHSWRRLADKVAQEQSGLFVSPTAEFFQAQLPAFQRTLREYLIKEGANLNDWIQVVYEQISGKGHVRLASSMEDDSTDDLLNRLWETIEKRLKSALDLDFCVVLDEAFVSPSTLQSYFVDRTRKQIWVGQKQLEFAMNAAPSLCSLLFDCAQAYSLKSKRTGSVQTVEDLETTVFSATSLQYRAGYDPLPNHTWFWKAWNGRREKKDREEQWNVSDNDPRLPWHPLFGERMVGHSEAMQTFFKELRAFAGERSTPSPVWLIHGPMGSGKTTVTQAIAQTMGLEHWHVHRIDLASLSSMDQNALREDLGKTMKSIHPNDRSGLLILDNFQDVEGHGDIQGLLLEILDPERKFRVGGETFDLSRWKIVLLANRGKWVKGQATQLEIRNDLVDRVGSFVEIPPLRGEPDEEWVRLAEYFNWIECQAHNIPWSPLDESAAAYLKHLAELVKFNSSSERRQLHEAMKRIVSWRKTSWEAVQKTGRLPENYDPDLPFSPVLTTMGDLIYAGNGSRDPLAAACGYTFEEIREQEVWETHLKPYRKGSPIFSFFGKRVSGLPPTEDSEKTPEQGAFYQMGNQTFRYFFPGDFTSPRIQSKAPIPTAPESPSKVAGPSRASPFRRSV